MVNGYMDTSDLGDEVVKDLYMAGTELDLSFNDNVKDYLKNLIRRMMRIRPEDRINMSEVVQTLKGSLSNRPKS